MEWIQCHWKWWWWWRPFPLPSIAHYHCNPADDSDDSLSDLSYHDKRDNLSSDLLFQEDEQTDSASERQQGNSASEREGGSDEETNSASERDVGFDKETDSASESVDGSGVGASGTSGSINTNPGPVIPLSDETAFSSTPVSQGPSQSCQTWACESGTRDWCPTSFISQDCPMGCQGQLLRSQPRYMRLCNSCH